ncbi:MAG TPA: hypothetical protein VMJ32_03245 [Pirellulales bacterium]|nr:hypothetical protein [Pirellulales bacterium]
MKRFHPPDYGPVFAPLLETAPLNALGPGRAAAQMREPLEAVSIPAAFVPHRVVDQALA